MMTESTSPLAPSPLTGSLFRQDALDRLSSAEPLDELVTLPRADDRVGLFAAVLVLIAAVAGRLVA